MSFFIEGFSISGYRSFGDEVQRIAPLDKVNLFIGQNNSGKSNILLFVSQHYSKIFNALKRNQAIPTFDGLDVPFGKIDSRKSQIYLAFNKAKLFDNICKNNAACSSWGKPLLKSFFSKSLKNITENNLIWFTYDEGNDTRHPRSIISRTLAEKIFKESKLNNEEVSNLRNALNNQTKQGYGIYTADRKDLINIIHQILNLISPVKTIVLPEIELIPAIRQVGEAGSKPNDFSGLGIIDRLAQLQNPPYNEQDNKQKFEQINKFLREVTNNSSARLEIPYDRDVILVHMDNKTLPLNSLGMGIHQVIILGAAATVLEEQIICIEELEIHQHPILQKKLIRYLQKYTSNQYFITTHSASLLDTPDAAIFHVKYHDRQSIVNLVASPNDKTEICTDLGYHASDLLQTNCVIWVEGPSDRIYLKHWIESVDADLVEGIHYSIMFYGGRLLSHLSGADDFDDEDVTEFISLKKLNRYSAIMIDSDKEKPRSRINSTKKRIREEFGSGSGFAWVTKGREVENYIEPEILRKAIKAVHPNAECLNEMGDYDNCLLIKSKKGKEASANKVKVAREVVKEQTNLDILDLKEKVNQLIEFIRQANGI